MTANFAKPTRADLVRRRRVQESKRRFEAATYAARTVRPLVSQPRRVSKVGAKPGRGRRFAIALPFVGVDLRAPTLPHIVPTWRWASGAMVLLLGAMLIRLLIDPRLYIDGINLGGAALVPGEEIYAQSGVARQHIFWVDPVAVQQNVADIPGIATASVEVIWPGTITIVVTERIPVVTWVEGEREWWVDPQGQKFKARGDLPGLLPISMDDVPTEFGSRSFQDVPVEAIEGALQLRELRPNIELLHYDSQHGLSYQDGRGWRGYFGVGTDMAQKLAVYETLVDNLLSRGVQPAAISVENLKAPYYRK